VIIETAELESISLNVSPGLPDLFQGNTKLGVTYYTPKEAFSADSNHLGKAYMDFAKVC
jgi:hypothetical protein